MLWGLGFVTYAAVEVDTAISAGPQGEWKNCGNSCWKGRFSEIKYPLNHEKNVLMRLKTPKKVKDYLKYHGKIDVNEDHNSVDKADFSKYQSGHRVICLYPTCL